MNCILTFLPITFAARSGFCLCQKFLKYPDQNCLICVYNWEYIIHGILTNPAGGKASSKGLPWVVNGNIGCGRKQNSCVSFLRIEYCTT